MDSETFGAGKCHDVGQIIFARRVAVADSGGEAEERICRCKNDAGIAERDSTFVRAGVFPFDDPDQVVALGHHAPVAPGVGGLETEEYDVGTGGAGGGHRVERLGADERGIAKEHDGIAAGVLQSFGSHRHGMGGA